MTTPVSLHTLLLVGTARAQPPAELLDAELAEGLADAAALTPDAPAVTPERRLWLAAGAADLWTRAGYLPPPAPAPATAPTASPAERLAACPIGAEAILKRLPQGNQHAALQIEWLDLLAGIRARLPERLLPVMLDLATRQPALRPRIEPVLGMRGQWLAALEPAWAWVAQAPDPDQLQQAWQEGTLERRVAALERWRRTDPAAARAALEAAWPAEPPENRLALLPCLGTGLQAADEAFLDTVLDDRRKPVRQAAQRLLAGLPESGLVRRMRARAALLLQADTSSPHGARLVVTLPAERDASMVRDGLGDGRFPGFGEKAAWLTQILAAIPPAHWSASFGLTPDQCIALSAATDYHEELLTGWTSALQLHLPRAPTPDLVAWLAAWSRLWFTSGGTLRHQHFTAFAATHAALPAQVRHALLLELVEASGMPWRAADDELVMLLRELAGATPAPWPADLSLAIARRLLATLATLSAQDLTLGMTLHALAIALDPAAVLAAEREWPGLGADPYEWQAPVSQFFELARFRHEMIHSFQESA